MSAAKLCFWGVIAAFASFAIVLITNLPTMFDILVNAVTTVLAVIAGRKSMDWF